MRVWTERQGELRGHYEINLAATALLQLLALRHPALAAVQARSSTDMFSHSACRFRGWGLSTCQLLALRHPALAAVQERSLQPAV